MNTPTVQSVQSRSATVVWTMPEQPNGQITQFELFYAENQLPFVTVAGSIFQYTLKDLTPNTQYNVLIRASTVLASGPKSGVAQVITLEDGTSLLLCILLLTVYI